MNTLDLTGLVALNPLGFFAALGLLRILDDHAVQRGLTRPRLCWAEDGEPFARLTCVATAPELVEIVLKDAKAQGKSKILRLAYDADGEAVSPDSEAAQRDLKPPPELAREVLRAHAGAPRREADLAAAMFSELVTDQKGNIKPTAFHFTAGQQTFLGAVEKLRAGITAADLEEALHGPWIGNFTLPSLSWDATANRQYALRATDPSADKRSSIAGANWLAVHGLAFFPVNNVAGRLVTTGVVGGWKNSAFTWPTWNVPLTSSTIASLIRSTPAATDRRRWSSQERAAMGVHGVFSAKILRSEQGGYGSFTPAEVVLPR